MASIAPFAFAWLRIAGSALLMNVVVRGTHFNRRDTRRIAGFSVLAVVLNQTLFLGGLARTTAHVAAILITTIPVFALGAAIVVGRERATGAKIGGIALSAAGALLVIGGEGIGGAMQSLLGSSMIVANCLCYALYLVLFKPDMERLSPAPVLARMFAIGTLLMLPISLPSLLRQDWQNIPPLAWIILGLVILGPTVGAYMLNAWALRHAESSLVAAYTYVQPVLATILAAVFLHEQLHASVAVAAAMIFAGVAIAGRGRVGGPVPE